MTTENPDRLRVLVVDDDPEWLRGLRSQSTKLSSSRLEIKTSTSFEDGLEFLHRGNGINIDVVVVDYRLNHDHFAFEFIGKARAMGIGLPYVIVSNAERTEVLGDRSRLDEFVQLGPCDFIEKIDIRRFLHFQQRIFRSYQQFRENTIQAVRIHLAESRQNLDNMYVVACEIGSLIQTISSYSDKIKDGSFAALCVAIDNQLSRLLAHIRHALDDIPPLQLPDDYGLLFSPEISRPTDEQLQTCDRIPYSKSRKRIIAWLKRCEKSVSASISDDDTKTLVSTLISKERETDQKFAEIVGLHLADHFAKLGSVEKGTAFLFLLSQAFAEAKQNDRVATTDMLTAAYLIEHGKTEQATTYLSAAQKLAKKMGTHTSNAVDRIVTPSLKSGQIGDGPHFN
jgi:CheY-like chemotaxis protein